MADFRILVTASRTWDDYKSVFDALDLALAEFAASANGGEWRITVVHGKCDPHRVVQPRRAIPWHRAIQLPRAARLELAGGDWHASQWVDVRKLTWGDRVGEEAVPADWHPAPLHLYDGQAGFKRNADMVDRGAHLCLAFIGWCVSDRCKGKRAHGSHGATHCSGLARSAAIPVRKFRP